MKKEKLMQRVAFVHDWLVSRRGGEKVLEALLDIYPQADVFSLFGEPHLALDKKYLNRNFHFSFLQKIPFIQKFYQWFLPLFPLAIESLNVLDYDLVISSSHCVAKGIMIRPDATHITYLHSPMRYAWDQMYAYLEVPKNFSIFKIFKYILFGIRFYFLHHLRIWDVTSTLRCHHIISNSHFVKKRCELYYGKPSVVIHPPVQIDKFYDPQSMIYPQKKVLLFGSWVPYKKNLWALQILSKENISVIAAGHGKEFDTARKLFKAHKNIEFVDSPTDAQLSVLYRQSHVLLHPGIEDFGIIPVEAMAAGLYIVCPEEGGTKDTVIPGETGWTFPFGSKDSMLASLHLALDKPLEKQALYQHAQKFSGESFAICIRQYIDNLSLKT